MVSQYEGFLAEFYGGMAESYSADLTWPAHRVGSAPAEVLELCCGSGRLTALLAGRGHTVTGVDNAPAMIARAERRRAAAPAEVAARQSFVEADVLELELGRRFDHVVLCGLSVSTFTDPARRARLFAAAARHLRPGGRLIFDHLPGPAEPHELREEIDVIPLGAGTDGFVLAGTRRSAAEGTQVANFYVERIAPDGRTGRLLSHNVLAMLDAAGLDTEVGLHGFGPGAGELVHPGVLLAEQAGVDAAVFADARELAHLQLRFVAFEREER